MTLLDIIDTAVKIGLGAAISGVFVALNTRATHSHELRKERLRRRQDTIERLIEQFEQIHTFITECYSYRRTVLRHPDDQAAKQKLAELLERAMQPYQQLHVLEGKFLLLGLPDCTT